MALEHLNTYARIGKDVISKAIGLQKNHKEMIINGPDKLNEIKSGCHSCPFYQAKLEKIALGLSDADSPCHNCTHAVWEHTYSFVYINEKNQYGYQPTLKTNAIKLLLLYHFLQPDPLGLLKNVELKELAKTLGCTVTTIRNCNDVLVEYGYCYTSNTGWEDGYINVLLPSYKDYHKTAKEGGRGYLTMTSAMFVDLLTIDTLNSLRLTLKGLLEVDNQSIHSTDTNAKMSYKKLRYFLPDYCRRNVIKKALELDNPIFNITLKDDCVIYKLPEKLSQSNQRKELENRCTEEIKDYIGQLNNLLCNKDGQEPLYSIEDFHAILSAMSIDLAESYRPIIIPTDAYRSLGSMCAQYSPQIVKSAIAIVYNNFINKGKIVENFGALIRTTIRHLPVFQMAS